MLSFSQCIFHNFLFLFLFFSSLCLLSLTQFFTTTLNPHTLGLHFFFPIITGQMASLFISSSFLLFFFLSFTLFTSNHNKYKSFTLTLLQPKFLFFCLDTVENWKLKTEKYYSKIIFKCVNSIVRPIFNEKITEKWNLWVHKQCTVYTDELKKIRKVKLYDYCLYTVYTQ